jgi:large subunit ribosomal protein LP2
MKHVAAYMLATLGGNEQPSSEDIKMILSAAGIACEVERAQELVSALSGKNVDEVVSAGMSKLASMPAGVSVAAAPAAASGAAAAAPAAAAAKEAAKEESDDDMGFGLFD